MAKRVAVIGAGCTGLGAIKSCLDENLVPTCFESASDIGGLWRFTDDVTDKRGSVMNSTVINTSKEMMSFSDFPAPEEFPNFMHHSKVLEYFRLYAKKFALLQHIRFNKEVLSITKHKAAHLDSTKISNECVRNKIDIGHKSTSDVSVWENCSRTIVGVAVNNYSNNTIDQRSCENFKSEKGLQNENNSDENSTTIILTAKSKDFDHDVSVHEETTVPNASTQWEINVKDKMTEKVTAHYFDCVLICTGHHADINLPYFPGQSIFKGRIIHSRDLRRANAIAGSRHVVVGIGNSACDAAVELSRYGQVYLSTRRGTWLMQRLQKSGLPADITYMSRLVFAFALGMPAWILNKIAEFHLNKVVDHSLYGLRPRHSPFATHPTINDELPNRIASGHVIVKPNIDSFTDNGVKFEDGTFIDDVDSVVMATGYKIGFPFLDQSTVSVKGNQCPLYLYMFPPTVTPPTLAVIGCIQAGGAVVPVSEMQCRLATRVFKNEVKLPSQLEMLHDIALKKRAMDKRYIHTQRHTIQVDFLPYMDELATLVGCKPKLVRLLIKNPRLAYACIFGPCTAYQYRLMGPSAWSGAREAIMTQMDRVRFPFRTRPIEDKRRALPSGNFTAAATIFFISLYMLVALIFLNGFLSR